MSKVTYTVNVDEYICSALEEMRTMCKTLDFAHLPATIERIQHHANRMESAIATYDEIKWGIKSKAENEDVSDAEFREYVKNKVSIWKKDSRYE